ncbi:MAG: peptidoglycan-binding protein [Acidimicrobiia bacterium]|nr:peptidoglycan-binding protein [Acidimicrobiia bacterium]
MRSRRIVAAIALTVVAVASIGGYLVGSHIQSPAEVAARTAPPEASPILVPAEQRLLQTDIVTRGTARFVAPETVSVATSSLKVDPGVVTQVPTPQLELAEGAVVASASGRPLFLLEGAEPMYRDLGPGSQGNDVMQLEEALARLGYQTGPVDGVYDLETGSAIAAWYRDSGWQPFEATPEQIAAIRALKQDSLSAEKDRLSADDAVAGADADLASARAAKTGTVLAVNSAALALSAAEAEANAANLAAALDVAAKRRTRDSLLTGSVADLAVAEAELDAAEAVAEAARIAGEVAVQSARDTLTTAEAESAAAQSSVAAAGRILGNARRQRSLLNRTLAQLDGELASAEAAADVQLPADEVLFLPSLPVRIDQVNVAAGDQLVGPIFTATQLQLAIDTSLPLDEAPLIKPGMTVQLDEPTLGITGMGTVGRVADRPGTDGVDGFHIYAEILVDEAPSSIVGTSVRLTIPIESTGGETLAVPVNALFLAADGTSRVEIQRPEGLVFVTVEPGLSAGGFAAVTPVDGELNPGDLVVIGFDTAVASGA